MSRELIASSYRLDEGNDLHINHPLHVQVRTGPIDERLWHMHYRSNPHMLAQENHRKIQHGFGFPEIQAGYAEKLRVPSAKFETELFHTQSRARKHHRGDATLDKLPVFTMGSDWFREANEAAYYQNGTSRPMFNNNRTYFQ
jgi:hypothetical protein